MWAIVLEAAYCNLMIVAIPVLLLIAGLVKLNSMFPNPEDDPDEGHIRVYWNIGDKKAPRN